MDLAGKIALVTGGTRGIGAATALELARRGSDIVVTGRDREPGEEIARRIAETGRRCLPISADASRPEEAHRCVERTVEELGAIDVLIHCAGGPVPGRFVDVSEADWYRAFDLHVHAAFHLCRAAIPSMKAKREGAIVLVSSTAGLRGVLNAAAYAIVKGALFQFTRVLARELADDNIRVNCVAPGVIRTRFHDHLTPEQVRNNLENRIPLHREGTTEQVAEVIAMLVTNDYITGESVVIDGGLTSRMA